MRPASAFASNLRRAAAAQPLPHPSWSAALARQEGSRRISASEFWNRLGL